MRIKELLEGGWDSKVTQGTVIHPRTVAVALDQMQRLVRTFNAWLAAQDLAPVELGRPTGSGTYHQQDAAEDPNKIYGDIDLQMIGPPRADGQTLHQYTSRMNQLFDQWIKDEQPRAVHPDESKPGHPIVSIGPDQWVQIDFMWHDPQLRHWGAARVTPQRGVKGMLMGNLFSALGELLGMSIQHAGVQIKTIDGAQVPFSKQKGVEVQTISTDPRRFLADILRYEHKVSGSKTKLVIDPLLKAHAGIDPDDVKIQDMVDGIKGLATSLERNGLLGKGNLSQWRDAGDFIRSFVERYEQKALTDVAGTKRDKAETPEAKARADADRQKILQGLEMVKAKFG